MTKLENYPSLLIPIRVKSAQTFRIHFNFIALTFFCDCKSNDRGLLEANLLFCLKGYVYVWAHVPGGVTVCGIDQWLGCMYL